MKKTINDLAEANMPLLFSFMARHKASMRSFGGRDEFLSELYESYLRGITDFVSRKRKHKRIRFSTFVWRALEWQIANSFRKRWQLIHVPRPSAHPYFASQARRIVFFHGTEGRCNDSALLVDVDYLGSLTKDERSAAVARALKTIHGRLAEVVRLSFGIGCDQCNFEEIGKRFGVSRGRVKQLVDKGIRLLVERQAAELKKHY